MGRLLHSHSEKETMRIAEQVGSQLGPGSVVALGGVAGAGKTHFVKGFVRAFGLSPEVVNSPTFTLIHEYPGSLPIYHFDCYRLENATEALAIGAEEYFYGEGVSIIEWPENISEIVPVDAVKITISVEGPNSRSIELYNVSLPEYGS